MALLMIFQLVRIASDVPRHKWVLAVSYPECRRKFHKKKPGDFIFVMLKVRARSI